MTSNGDKHKTEKAATFFVHKENMIPEQQYGKKDPFILLFAAFVCYLGSL